MHQQSVIIIDEASPLRLDVVAELLTPQPVRG